MRFANWYRRLVVLVMTTVGGTGLLWFGLHDIAAQKPGDMQHYALVMHGISSAGILIIFGSALPLHVPVAWRWRRNMFSGIGLIGAIALLGVTGLMLYYLGEDGRWLARWMHVVVGLASLVVAPWHLIRGARWRRRDR
jgi:hypothetical protein